MKHFIILYAAILIVMAGLDAVWIGGVAREFYKNRISNLEFHPIPALLFYLLYAVGVLIFAGGHGTWQSVLLYGALFGFFAYSTYDLTNLATLRGWPVSLAVVDILWGTFVTAFAASAGWYITLFFERP